MHSISCLALIWLSRIAHLCNWDPFPFLYVLRPNRREGDGSRASLKVLGTARVTLPPWWDGEPGDAGKILVSSRLGGRTAHFSLQHHLGQNPALELQAIGQKSRRKHMERMKPGNLIKRLNLERCKTRRTTGEALPEAKAVGTASLFLCK